MTESSRTRSVIILGSTGSIGTQALDVIRRNRARYDVVALGAGGANLDLLAQQVQEFAVPVVAVADEARVPELSEHLGASARADRRARRDV